MRADDFLNEGGLRSWLWKLGKDTFDYAAGQAPKVKNFIDQPKGGSFGGRVPASPDEATHVYRNMNPDELEAARKSGYFEKNPNPGKTDWDTDKKYWSQGDTEGYFGRSWKDSPDNAQVRLPQEKLPRWTAGKTGDAEVLDKTTGTWNPVKEDSTVEDRHPNDRPYGPETKPTMPKGTVRVDVSDVYDWYKLGMHISDLKNADKSIFGKGPPSTIFSFGSEEEEHEYIKQLEKLGLTTTDIDPVDPDQPPGMPRQKVDPTFNVNEDTESKTVEFEGLTLQLQKESHQLRVKALDEWGNKALGFVEFNIGDGKELDPQDLRVDDRYQSQGIARIMYDYVKSLGYTINRSSDQTPAGKGFWDKHRGEDTNVWENFADGKNPGRKGLSKRMGVNTKASVSDLRKTAKNSSGEKQRMAHWLANMKSGRNKNK